MPEAVIVEALRTPIARGKMGRGELSGFHAAQLLGQLQLALTQRAGIAPADVEQIIGGCVTQAGEQSNNITRHAWLGAQKESYSTAGTTIDVQCGSGQQANHLVAALVECGAIEIGIACGIELMSHVGLGMNVMNGPGFFLPPDFGWDQPMTQFNAAQRIAEKRGITREDADAFALASQQKAAAARDAGNFAREILPINAPVLDADAKATGETRRIKQDQGIRETSAQALAELKPVEAGGIQTAGNSSQVSDGAAGLLYMSAAKAKELGLRPRARIVQQVVTGADPEMLLEGPIDATRKLVQRGAKLQEVDVFECNEAFATIPLAWMRAFPDAIDPQRVNPNGGAIALGHPVGATGSRLLVSALHELERSGGARALVTMCCGSAVGTATILERL